MDKFKNLRLKKRKGLDTAELVNLGKINVICGPNNSGKTTVLECIAEETSFSFGLTLDEEILARIEKKSMEGKHWRRDDQARMYPLVLAQASRERTIWFNDESKDFWTELLKVWNQAVDSSTPGEPSDLIGAYTEEFRKIPSRVLIPAKRKLDTTQSVQAFERIQPVKPA